MGLVGGFGQELWPLVVIAVVPCKEMGLLSLVLDALMLLHCALAHLEMQLVLHLLGLHPPPLVFAARLILGPVLATG